MEFINLNAREEIGTPASRPGVSGVKSRLTRILTHPVRTLWGIYATVGRKSLIAERDALIRERDALIRERDALIRERDALIRERNALFTARNELIGEHNALFTARNELIGERDALIRERDAVIGECNALFTALNELIREAQKSVAPPRIQRRALSDFELAGLLPVELPRRAVVNGFPGAGNVLAERICSALLKTAGLLMEQPRVGGGNQACDSGSTVNRAFGSRLSWLLSRLPDALPRGREWESFFSHGATGSVVFVAIRDPDFLLVSGLELNAYINTAVHATHELPSRGSYAFYAEQGLQVIPVVRHPLDILVSFASKLSPSLAQRVSTAAATAGISPRDVVCRADCQRYLAL